MWCHGVVITTTQLHSTKPELMYFTGTSLDVEYLTMVLTGTNA